MQYRKRRGQKIVLVIAIHKNKYFDYLNLLPLYLYNGLNWKYHDNPKFLLLTWKSISTGIFYLCDAYHEKWNDPRKVQDAEKAIPFEEIKMSFNINQCW